MRIRTFPKFAAVTLVVLASLVVNAMALAADAPADKRKETTLGKYVTAREAYHMWLVDKDKVKVLDVRTVEEYSFIGHAPMAVNVPVRLFSSDFNAEKKEYPLKENPNFAEEVKARFGAEDTILVMCRSGQRSAMAVNKMAEAGFKNVYNIVDGFEGDTLDNPESYFHGKRVLNGWKNSGNPWTYGLDPALVYQPKK